MGNQAMLDALRRDLLESQEQEATESSAAARDAWSPSRARRGSPCHPLGQEPKPSWDRKYDFKKNAYPGSKEGDGAFGGAYSSTRDGVTGSGEDTLFGSIGWHGDDLVAAELGLTRVKMAGQHRGLDASLTSQLAVGRLAMGSRNPDGSEGVYMSGGLNLAGIEATTGSTESGNELTVGGGLGVGFGGGFGVRDKNGDGSPELCGRLELAVLLGVDVGACMEADQIFTAPAMEESPEDAYREECVVGCHTPLEHDPRHPDRLGAGLSLTELAELEARRPEVGGPWVRPDRKPMAPTR